MKQCKSSLHVGDKWVDVSLFGKNKRQPDGLHYSCKACIRASDQKRYNETSVLVKERVQRWRNVNPDKVNKIDKNYRLNNQEQRQISNKKWRESNPQLVCFLANKRRANKLNATPSWSNMKIIQSIYLSCSPGYEVHHIVPLQEDDQVCGLHCEANLWILPHSEHVKLHSSIELLRASYLDGPTYTE